MKNKTIKNKNNAKSVKNAVMRFVLINLIIIASSILFLFNANMYIGYTMIIPLLIIVLMVIFSLNSIQIFKAKSESGYFKIFRKFVIALNITFWISLIQTILTIIVFKKMDIVLLDLSELGFWLLLLAIFFISLLINKKNN